MTRLLEERCHLLRGNRIISLLCLGTDSLSSGQRRLIPRAARAGIQDPGSSRGAAARPWPLSPAPPPLELSRRFSHRCPFSASSPSRVSIPGCEHIAVCPKSSLLGNSWKQDRGGNRTASAGTGRRAGNRPTGSLHSFPGFRLVSAVSSATTGLFIQLNTVSCPESFRSSLVLAAAADAKVRRVGSPFTSLSPIIFSVPRTSLAPLEC